MAKPPPPPALIDAGNLRHVPSVEKFFAKLHDLLRVPMLMPLPLIIELRGTRFIYPEGVLALICAARLWYKATGQPTVLHMSNEVHSYLDRIDLFKACSPYFHQTNEPVDPLLRTTSRNLLEVLELSNDVDENEEQIPRAISRAYSILYRDFDAARVGAIGTLISEITANIPHSNDKGFAVIQRYPKSNTVHMGIADLGTGIVENLRANPECRNYTMGSEFIKRVLEGGVTSRKDGSGGMGLNVVGQIVRNGEGVLTIRSGTSIVQAYQSGDPDAYDELPFIPGVQVFLTVYGTPDEVL